MGEQPGACMAVGNPFEDVKTHINEYTAQEIATLSSRLEKKLGPEYISTRPGAAGQRVPYLAGDKCISLANEVFGFNGEGLDRHQGRIAHMPEDLGYGHIENCKSKAAAFEKAKKQGTTDALKRALRNFGNVLGNCVHDADYMSKVTKMQVAPVRTSFRLVMTNGNLLQSKWDPEKLHRHPDYAPVNKTAVGQGHNVAQIKKEPASEKVLLQMKGDGNNSIRSDV
ncbi:MAG: hypothetical protein Q9212_001685 [Teloschistes hypoglaucus]